MCFKVLHALDASYPKESEREWFFLERVVYAINLDKKMMVLSGTGKDKKNVDISSKVLPACTDYENFKKKLF